MPKSEKKSFVLYQNYENMFEALPMNERGKLITAIFAYTRDGSEPAVRLSDAARMAYVCIRDTLDRDLEAYRARCEQNAQNARKSHSNRPRTQANGSLNDNENKNENENFNDNGINNGNEQHDEPQYGAFAQNKQEKKELRKRISEPPMSTFDTDDFFQAALEHSFRH